MRSVKPGRGPSFMGGFGSLIAALFGVIWTIVAAKSGAPFPFPLFGVLFVILGVAQAVYNFANATRKDRFSSFDITEHNEEIDPLNARFGRQPDEPRQAVTKRPREDWYAAPHQPAGPVRRDAQAYCPYCGTKTEDEFEFCPSCGRELPDPPAGY